MPWVRGYTRSDGTRVRSYVRRSPRRAADFVISLTVAGFAISSSGGSVAEGASSADDGKADVTDVTLSPDDVQVSYERAALRLARSGYSFKDLHLAIDSNCVEHSYGEVQEFFRSNTCKWLARAYVVVQKKGSDGSILVDFVWVDMSTSAQAEECQQLMETFGAGSVTELAREDDSPYKDTDLPIDFYVPGIHTTAAWNVQVQPFIPLPAGVIGTVIQDSQLFGT